MRLWTHNPTESWIIRFCLYFSPLAEYTNVQWEKWNNFFFLKMKNSPNLRNGSKFRLKIIPHREIFKMLIENSSHRSAANFETFTKMFNSMLLTIMFLTHLSRPIPSSSLCFYSPLSLSPNYTTPHKSHVIDDNTLYLYNKCVSKIDRRDLVISYCNWDVIWNIEEKKRQATWGDEDGVTRHQFAGMLLLWYIESPHTRLN